MYPNSFTVRFRIICVATVIKLSIMFKTNSVAHTNKRNMCKAIHNEKKDCTNKSCRVKGTLYSK